MELQKEGILARIRVVYKAGGDIAYFTDKRVLHTLDLTKDKEFTNLTVIKKGTIITTSDDIKLKIVDISTHFYDKTDKIDRNYGMSIYGIGEDFPFNFEITYLVEEV
jgi:hypothetical protein